MLKKLFLYDLKTLAKSQVPCLIGIVGGGVLGLLLTLAIWLIPEEFALLTIIPTLLLIFTILALYAAMIVGLVALLSHFYKKFFTDEGYLTFSFPATVETQFLSKVLSAVVYLFALGIALIVAVVLMLVLPVALNMEVFSLIFTSTTVSAESFIAVALTIFSLLISPFSQIILFYTAITLGAIYFQKHKIIGAILFYMISNTIVSVVSSVVMIFFTIPASLTGNPALATTFTLLGGIIVMLATTIIGYLISINLLHKKLNLE